MRLQASATPIRQHSTVMQIGTDDVYNCEVQPDKTTFQTVEVVDVELEYEADSCGRVASNRSHSLPGRALKFMLSVF